jgi:hypothetical protein
MVDFDASGNVHWSVPGDQPQIATADGGLIGQSGITYDQNGNATGQNASLSGGQSPGWGGNVLGTVYSASGSAVSSQVGPTTNYAATFAALQGGNASYQGTAIQQVMAKLPQNGTKQLPSLGGLPLCYPLPTGIPPTCGNINAIELLTSLSPDFIFQTYIQTFLPVTQNANSVVNFTGPGSATTINVTGSDQVLTITLRGFQGAVLSLSRENPFSVMTERFDPVAHTISAVTLAGHPLAGWRYWRVYSIGTNDVVIETGAYDQPGPGIVNYVGNFLARRTLNDGWREYLQFIQKGLGAPQGSNLRSALGGIALSYYSWPDGPLLEGYWDYFGTFTQYILNNVCQSTSCN